MGDVIPVRIFFSLDGRVRVWFLSNRFGGKNEGMLSDELGCLRRHLPPTAHPFLFTGIPLDPRPPFVDVPHRTRSRRRRRLLRSHINIKNHKRTCNAPRTNKAHTAALTAHRAQSTNKTRNNHGARPLHSSGRRRSRHGLGLHAQPGVLLVPVRFVAPHVRLRLRL